MTEPTLPAPLCGVCGSSAPTTALLVGRFTLPACVACARRLIDGDFIYAPRPELRVRERLGLGGDGPVAFPLRAVH